MNAKDLVIGFESGWAQPRAQVRERGEQERLDKFLWALTTHFITSVNQAKKGQVSMMEKRVSWVQSGHIPPFRTSHVRLALLVCPLVDMAPTLHRKPKVAAVVLNL